MLAKDYLREFKELLKRNPELENAEIIGLDATGGEYYLVDNVMPLVGKFDEKNGTWIETGMSNKDANSILVN